MSPGVCALASRLTSCFANLAHVILQLLSAGELTSGIQASEYATRRRHLVELLGPGCLAVIPSASTQYVAGVVPWPYRQVRRERDDLESFPCIATCIHRKCT